MRRMNLTPIAVFCLAVGLLLAGCATYNHTAADMVIKANAAIAREPLP